MVNRKSAAEIVDVNGYGHILKNNLSYEPRQRDKQIANVDLDKCNISNNSFLPNSMTVTDDDFVSLDASQLMLPRKADGSLPDIDFMKLKTKSKLYKAGLGFSARNNENIIK